MQNTGERGELLWEYLPPRAHPIVYAGLVAFAFVLATGSVENALRGGKPHLYAAYAAPLAATATLWLLLRRGPTRIHRHGIAPGRPLVARAWRPFVRWDGLAAVYPVSYDVTGAFVSPFASSDGKVTQTGIGIEWPDGRTETVRFTPTRFSQAHARPEGGQSRGYREAMEVVRDVFVARGRPLVSAAEAFAPEERARMLAEARRPFLPFFAIVLLFASAAPVLWALAALARLPLPAALPLALALPLATSLQSWRASRRRNRTLNRLSKEKEYLRGPAASAATDSTDGRDQETAARQTAGRIGDATQFHGGPVSAGVDLVTAGRGP